jgi:hypothetical protein
MSKNVQSANKMQTKCQKMSKNANKMSKNADAGHVEQGFAAT